MYNPEFIKNGLFTEEELPIAELIQKRRLQILVHSAIYYNMDRNLISDKQYDAWGYELVDLQTKYPDIIKRICFDETFKDYDGSTGFNLDISNDWVNQKATHLLNIK